MSAELEAAAYHEAGHTVARIYRGLPVPPVVEIGHDGGGETHGTGHRVRFDAFGAAVVALAGPAAEHRHYGKPYAWDESAAELLEDWDDDSDDAEVARMVRDHGVTVAHALTQVSWIFDEHWTEVERVAHALLTAPDGRVTGEQVAAMTRGMEQA